MSFKLFSTLFSQLLVGLFVSLGLLLDVPTSLCSPQGFQDASKVLRDVSGQAEPTPRQQHFPRPCLEPRTSANASGPSTTFSDKAQSTTPPFCVILLSFAGAVTRSIFSHHRMKPSPKPWGGCVSVCGDQSILAAWICSPQPHNHPRPHPLENYWLLEEIANIQRSCQMLCPAGVVCALQALVPERFLHRVTISGW